MNFDFTESKKTFARRSASWLERNLPDDLRGRGVRRVTRRPRGGAAAARLAAQDVRGRVRRDGLAAEFGGRGACLVEMVILYQEMARAESPQIVNRGGVSMLGPTLMKHGTAAQQERFLKNDPHRRGDLVPGILRAERGHRSRQSPDARGASTATTTWSTARRSGRAWAHVADWCFLLVRTDPAAAKHKGISFLLVDMKTPGHHRAAAAPDHRRGGVQRDVPRQRARAGREPRGQGERGLGRGHHHARATSATCSRIIRHISLRNALHRLIKLAQGPRGARGRSLSARSRRRCWIGEQALQINGYRSLTNIMSGGHPGPEGSTVEAPLEPDRPGAGADRHRDHRPLLAARARHRLGAGRGPVGVLRAARARQRHPRGHHRDPEEHPGRARARSAEGLRRPSRGRERILSARRIPPHADEDRRARCTR